MKLPKAHLAVIYEKKITDYLLNVQHPDGKSKAAFFIKGGFEIENWSALAHALLQHPFAHDVFPIQKTDHGVKYTVKCAMTTPSGRAPCIVSVWMDDS